MDNDKLVNIINKISKKSKIIQSGVISIIAGEDIKGNFSPVVIGNDGKAYMLKRPKRGRPSKKDIEDRSKMKCILSRGHYLSDAKRVNLY